MDQERTGTQDGTSASYCGTGVNESVQRMDGLKGIFMRGVWKHEWAIHTVQRHE